MSGDSEIEPLFGRFETATFLAVEAANGGEWAGLEQVAEAFVTTFNRVPDADQFQDACALLCETGLIEYVQNGLELSPKGRKLLRRAGMPASSSRPAKVAELLNEIPESEIADEGSVSEPTSAEVHAALEQLGFDRHEGSAPVLGEDLAPQPRGAGLMGTFGMLGNPNIQVRIPNFGGVRAAGLDSVSTGSGSREDPDLANPEGQPLVPPLEDEA